MSSWADGRRPLTLAILALGGEGGGVLADWIVVVADVAGWHAQNTSVAGVAQRTGATVYYVELFPPVVSEPPAGEPRAIRAEPVMSIFPSPGEVDVVITSELMESGRAIQRGFVTPDRTTLITSTNRVYSIDEKMSLGDGRVDDGELLAGARRAARLLIAADFARLAEREGSVISASLFGALAGSAALPFSREQFEHAIRASGKSVDASLAAFAAGFEVAAPDPDEADGTLAAGDDSVSTPSSPSRSLEAEKQAQEDERNRIAEVAPESLVGPALRDLAQRTREVPRAARSMVLHGLVRTAVYQDHDYADRYLERVRRFARIDPEADGEAQLTRAAAQHVALWMCYHDTIHVALQKTRRARLERVRGEARVRPGQRFDLHEFLHPQIDEITDVMPTRLGAALRESRQFQRAVRFITHKGMKLNTTSVLGYTLLTTMARGRPLRPRSLRFGREQELIDRWIDRSLSIAAAGDAGLALEVILCQAVLKGYGDTWARGWQSFEALMDAAERIQGEPDASGRLADLRAAALADETGAELSTMLRERVPA